MTKVHWRNAAASIPLIAKVVCQAWVPVPLAGKGVTEFCTLSSNCAHRHHDFCHRRSCSLKAMQDEERSAMMCEPTTMLLRKGEFGCLYEMQLHPTAVLSKTQKQRQFEEEFGECDSLPEYQGLLQLPLPVIATTSPTASYSSSQEQQQQQQLLCLHRYKLWWMRPVFVPPSFSNVPPETIFLLYQTTTTHNIAKTTAPNNLPEDHKENDSLAYQLVLPLVMQVPGTSKTSTPAVASSSLRGWKPTSTNDKSSEHDAHLIVTSQYPRSVIYVGSHPSDPFALIQEAAEMSKSHLLLNDDDTGLYEPPSSPDDVADAAEAKPTESGVVGHLGWCTWNAFYTNLSGPTIVQAVHQLVQEQKIPIRWLIIDDGWQHVTTITDNYINGMELSQRLMSIRENPVKFQEMSLKDCISTLRQSYHIRDVFCWHTLTGCWLGVQVPTTSSAEDDHNSDNASSGSAIPASALYFPKFSSGLLENDPSIYGEKSVALGIGIPNDPLLFWNSYHSYLRDCGVSGVKVDAQAVVASIMSFITNGNKELRINGSDKRSKGASTLLDSHSTTTTTTMVKTMVQRLQNAMINSVGNNFGNPNHHIIHCMAHAPEIFYFLPRSFNKATKNGQKQQKQQQQHRHHHHRQLDHTKPLLRAADDLYPDNLYSHGSHLVECAFNSLLLSQVARVDWDMFTTCLEKEWCVRLHAVSRCLSGGPLYVSDAPDRIVKSAIDWIACSDGTTLTCREAARPILDCLLRDPLSPDSLPLAIYTTNGDASTPSGITSGVLGLFHVAGSGQWDYDKLDYISNSNNACLSTPKSIHVMPRHIAFYSQSKFTNTEFVAISFFSKFATTLASPSSSFEVTMELTQSEAITFVPLTKMSFGMDVAPLGFLGTMINGAGAVTHCELDESSSRLSCRVRGCGRFWWAIRCRPAATAVDDISSFSNSWWNRLRFEMDGAEQQPQFVVRSADHDAPAMNSEHIPGGSSLLKKGFVLVSLDIIPSSKATRIMVLKVIGQ